MTRIHSSRTSRKARRSTLIATLGTAAAIAAVGTASPASAHDTYVDRMDGSDGSAECRKSSPCATIKRGLAKAGPGDTVYIGGDSFAYPTPVTLGKGKSLVYSDFSTDPAIDTSGSAKIDTGVDPRPAVTVASDAGRIEDLFINSQSTALEVHAAVRVIDNKFLEDGPMSGPVIDIARNTQGRAVIRSNSIHDSTPGEAKVGIRSRSTSAPLIHENALSGLSTAISARGRATIRSNEIWGTHTGGTLSGQGIVIRGGRAELSGNYLHATNPAGSVAGVLVLGDADFENNLVIDYDTGIYLKDTPRPVKFTGDVIRTVAGGGNGGLVAVDNTDSPGVSNPVVTNMTIVGPAQAVALDSVRLRMDSSIIGDTQGPYMSLSGSPTCRITNSRAPFAGTADHGCAFPMKKDPLFEQSGYGYHLTAASPMIDKGSKRTPSPGAKDIDGDRRALDGPDGGDCDGPGRRDIGADEFAC